MAVAIVTDSTSSLPAYLLEQARISVVPVHVIVDDHVFSEGVDISTESLVEKLRAGATVSTSKPNPEAFADVYRSLAFQGFSDIVSIHVSSELSGTYSSAVIAARSAELPVRVVDSRTIGMGLGFSVLAAADALTQGHGVGVVADRASRCGRAARAWLCVETLEYLHRGGRIGNAQAIVGNALALKPIVEIAGGRLIPRDKVRTTVRAHATLIDYAVSAAAEMGGAVELAVHHAMAAEKADQIATELGRKLPGVAITVVPLSLIHISEPTRH